MYKDHGMGAVIMVNSNEGEGILREIERAIAREYGWPEGLTEDKTTVKVSAETLDGLVGEYGGDTGFKCTITRENDRLFLKPIDQQPIELFPESDTKFFAKVLNAEITFEKDDGGKVKEITLQQDNKRASATRKR